MKKILLISVLILSFVLSSCGRPENIDFTKDYPSEVTVGETFDIKLNVKNKDTVTRELRSFDFESMFFDGFLIQEVNEDIYDEYSVFGLHVFEFRKDIEKESEKEVIFTLKALKKGDYSGDLDLCIDGDTSCIYSTIRIIVGDEKQED